MKVKNFFQLLGFRGRPKHYPYEVVEYDIRNVGVVKYAQWQHPRESIKVLTTELVDEYRQYIKEGDFCIDIGAHSGDTALPMAIAAGQSGCVLALEPNPSVYPVLEKVARANSNVVNIKTIMAAAAPEEGFIDFEYSDSGFCNGGRHEDISVFKHGHVFKQTVFTINLENELRADYSSILCRLSFLKVDAEGYDLQVLRSVEGIIREFRPIIKAEIFKKTDLYYRQNVLDFFNIIDYTVFKLTAEPLEVGEQLNQENLALGTHYDILALPNKTVNRTSS